MKRLIWFYKTTVPRSLRMFIQKLGRLAVLPFALGHRRKSQLKLVRITNSKPLLDATSASDLLRQTIRADGPCMIARFGAVELQALVRIKIRKSLTRMEVIYDDLQRGANTPWDSESEFSALRNNAGFFPINAHGLLQFERLMDESVRSVDILGSWLSQESIYNEALSQARVVELGDLEPYYRRDPWSAALEGQRVLIVHPFVESVTKQYTENRTRLFSNPKTLPEFKLLTYRSPQSIAGNSGGYGSWFDAFETMRHDVLNLEFDTAILGCGAYGFPLAAAIKASGRKAVHLGGATQILFGIKGARWDSLPLVSGLYNKYWIRPLESETPRGYKSIEAGCYW